MGTGRKHGSYEQHQADLLARLRKIEGQVRGIQKMVEEQTYCVDVLNQLSAVISASEKVALLVLEDHVRGCVADAAKSKDASEKIDELTSVLERFLKSGRSAVSR